MIPMIAYAQLTFDQIGNPLGRPQLCPISVSHRPLDQEVNEAFFLFRGESGWPAWRRLSFQRILSTGLQGIAPPEDSAGVAANAAGDFMEGKLLLQEDSYTASTLFQQFRRPMRSHEDTPEWDVSIILHYLCGSQ